VIVAQQILDRLRSQGKKLVVAESLTGGLLTSEFSRIAGASDVLLTGIIAYETSLKHELLGVSKALLENQGAVDPEVAAQMAEGLRVKIASKLGLDLAQVVAVSTTGVAGPGPVDGVPAGTVWVAIDGPISQTLQLELSGTREIVRNATIAGAIAAFARILKTL
jgi:nicotinamide-nucleotide amidase